MNGATYDERRHRALNFSHQSESLMAMGVRDILFLLGGTAPVAALALLLWFGPRRRRSFRDPREQ